jgi:acetyl esterase/lipase
VPAVIWIHGGGFSEGARWRLPLQWPQLSVFEALIRNGIAVVPVDYRHDGEGGGIESQIHDVRAAVRYVRRYAETFGVDPERIGVWGESAGGFLAAMVGLLGDRNELLGDIGVVGESSAVQAVVDYYGCNDLGAMFENEDAAARIGTTRARLSAISPAAHIPDDGALLPPFMLVHGTADTWVPFQESIDLTNRLTAVGADVDLITVEGAEHVFIGTDPLPIIEDSTRWLANRLRSTEMRA